jgi:hypothetical protein
MYGMLHPTRAVAKHPCVGGKRRMQQGLREQHNAKGSLSTEQLSNTID